MQFSKSGSSNHPVGMQYVDYFQQQPHNYKEPTSLNPNIQLVNGQVGCLSCHQLKVQNLASTGVQGGSMSLNNYCESSSDLTVESGADLCAACHKI